MELEKLSPESLIVYRTPMSLKTRRNNAKRFPYKEFWRQCLEVHSLRSSYFPTDTPYNQTYLSMPAGIDGTNLRFGINAGMSSPFVEFQVCDGGADLRILQTYLLHDHYYNFNVETALKMRTDLISGRNFGSIRRSMLTGGHDVAGAVFWDSVLHEMSFHMKIFEDVFLELVSRFKKDPTSFLVSSNSSSPWRKFDDEFKRWNVALYTFRETPACRCIPKPDKTNTENQSPSCAFQNVAS